MNKTPKEVAACYQPLFDLIFKEHDKALTMSEMDEVISAANKVTMAIDKIYAPTCDVEGCDGIVVSGGGAWEETGYWSLCDVHHFRGFRGKEQPKVNYPPTQSDGMGFKPDNECKEQYIVDFSAEFTVCPSKEITLDAL